MLECHTFVANHAFSNASRSIYLFLAQWRHVLPWKCCFVLPFHKSAVSYVSHVSPITVLKWYYHLLLSLLPWQWFSITLMLYHKIYELFYLWCQTNLKLQENGAINAQAAIQLKLQLDWLLLCDLWLYIERQSPRRPCDNNLQYILIIIYYLK